MGLNDSPDASKKSLLQLPGEGVATGAGQSADEGKEGNANGDAVVRNGLTGDVSSPYCKLSTDSYGSPGSFRPLVGHRSLPYAGEQIEFASAFSQTEATVIRTLSPVEKDASETSVSGKGAEKTADEIREDLQKRFGVQMREVNGVTQVYFRAGGKDNVLFTTDSSDAGLAEAGRKLQGAVEAKMQELTKNYKVEFGKEGEDVEPAIIVRSNCDEDRGDMIHAKQPTLPQLFGLEEGLKRSRPSQLTDTGKQGTKIYFLDAQILPPVYEGDPVMGLHREKDKDGKRAIYVTPEGGAIPPTKSDAESPDDETLDWMFIHEFSHNSQQNYWQYGVTPDAVAHNLGWAVNRSLLADNDFSGKRPYWMLEGKDKGEYYAHGSDKCGEDTVWYKVDAQGHPLNAQGKRVLEIKHAQQFSGDEVAARARVKPITDYFAAPHEMAAEGLTAYRGGRESRARLMRESPALYEAIKGLDETEIKKFYGVDASGKSRLVRTPEGYVVMREPATERSIASFEASFKRR